VTGSEDEAGGRLPATYRQVALVEVVDRVLDKGVLIAGDITLSVAGIDLVDLRLRALLASAGTLAGRPEEGDLPLRDH
jgi:hypothetical protein